MESLQRIRLPRRLPSRVWLITLPSALVSFERRQHIPRLPIGGLRFLGLPLMAAGAGLTLWAWRNPGTTISHRRPLRQLTGKPATMGGILVLAGAAVFLRSLVLAFYSLGLAFAAGTDMISIDEPDVAGFTGRQRD